jgi:hypothetical protein
MKACGIEREVWTAGLLGSLHSLYSRRHWGSSRSRELEGSKHANVWFVTIAGANGQDDAVSLRSLAHDYVLV